MATPVCGGWMMRRSGLVAVMVGVVGAAIGGVGSAAAATPRWTVVPSPNRFAVNQLSAVTLIPGRSGGAWAVGLTRRVRGSESLNDRPLIERWNGHTWSRVVVWEPTRDTRLSAVSAVSPSSAFAVGTWDCYGGFYAGIAEQWNGKVWRAESLPVNSIMADQWGASGVVELSPTDAWAVGGILINADIGGPALIEHWNGVKWSYVPAPTVPGQTQAYLTSARRISGTHTLIAVGQVTINGMTNRPLVMRYDGTSWSLAQAPSGADAPSVLMGVATMAPSSDYWVIGEGSYASEWTGSTWTPNSMPPSGPATTAIARVPSTSTLWAVGARRTGGTAAMFYNGDTWSIVRTPNPGTPNPGPLGGGLSDVTAASPTNAWAVGYYNTGRMSPVAIGSNTLILRYH
jgi:hypothetical protein